MARGPGRDQVKAMERLARIIAVLDNAGVVGATADQLLAVASYGGNAAPHDQLSADLRKLRSKGWQIDNLSGPGESGRYRMTSGDNRLVVSLDDAQRAALERAVILTERSDLAQRLGVTAGSLPEGLGSAVLPHEVGEELTLSLRAVRDRSRIRFSYKGSPRVVHPGSVRFQNYQWYLSGVEEGSDLVKHFAVSRMSEASLDGPGSAREVPEVRRIPLHPLLWQVDAPTPVTVRTTPEYAPDVVRWLMEPEARNEHDGFVDLHYTVTNREAFRARIYVLGTRVTLPDGGDVTADLVAALRRMVGQ